MKTPAATALLCLLLGAAARAEPIHIDKVVGQVWYCATASAAPQLLKPDMEISPGQLRTDLAGILYGSPRTGSEFRLAGATTINFKSNGEAARAGGGSEPDAVMFLTQGKITMTSSPGAGRYDIEAKGGKVGAGAGLCVICSAGDATHVYVARGAATIYPLKGIYRVGGLLMLARPSIAILNSNGVMDVQPLSRAGPGVQNCLLSGAAGGGGGAVENGLPNPANLKGNPAVSETQ